MPANRLVVVVLVVVSSIAALIDPVDALARPPTASVIYVPPVNAPVTDPFRPPAHPYGPGNRGLEYGTANGDPVRAAADGVVAFAGQVGGALHVTIRHADGLRTSYSFLASVAVRQNQSVRQGDLVGTAGGPFHFGVRDPSGAYLDPALLFTGQLRPEVHLVPGPDDGDGHPSTRAAEVRALHSVVRDRLVAATAFGARVAADVTNGWHLRARAAINVTAPAHSASIARSMQAWHLQRNTCTAADSVPARPSGRRIVVLVGGIGSSSRNAAVDKVDTASLGYAADDVVRFSYRGGRVPKPISASSPLNAIAGTTYGSSDTQQDLHTSAAQLAQLLAQIAAANPGVPIDVVAHSQGGVVSRLAITAAVPPPEVQTLTTLGTPHHGANLATAVAVARLDPRLHAGLRAARAAGDLDLDPDSPAASQLAETSDLIDAMNRRPLPSSVRVTSIGARGDLTVPAPRTIVGAGSTSTVVPVGGLHAHDDLPGASSTQREIALAISGAPPTCRSFHQALTDALASETIDALEDDLTATAAWAPVLVG